MWSVRPSRAELKRFWQRQAVALGSFKEASSTAYYLEGELRIAESFFDCSGGKKVLKLDLWNEVKNTDILAKLARTGAETFAIDLSMPLVRQARSEFRRAGLVPRFAVAHVYDLPFAAETFDYVYTMGTIEHVPEMDQCVSEIFRVLKPGGTAVVGLPNRLDPFLRPVAVFAMNQMGIYPYGYERALSRRQLSVMLEEAGFEVLGHEGVLFMPGVLRMAELFMLRRSRAASRMLGAMHWPFRLLARRFPGLNRHGYLIAAVVRKP